MTDYVGFEKTEKFPRIPLRGNLDLTYRCNNNCRHCWLRMPPSSPESRKELSLDEIKDIVDEARKMGCRHWRISGGEPMLRPDFAEIFDYITSRAASYSLNTNGTLITPEIARLMRRKGAKMVALYGATAEVHDHITRNPGSFEALMQGIAYLKEAGAGFTAQLVPMRDNYHQYNQMISLAESLTPHSRVGAAWLHLTASGDPERNREIKRLRLSPEEVVELDRPDLSDDKLIDEEDCHNYSHMYKNDRLFAHCVAANSEFHIDPYGQMTFCSFIKDPALRSDLRKGSFKECWETFIPTLINEVSGGKEYMDNCGSCELRSECRWCPVYGYLEHGTFSAKVEYLCAVARETKRFKNNWQKNHRRYYRIADITVEVTADLPITDTTFHPKFKHFIVDGPNGDTISIRHHFSLPDLDYEDLGKEVYRKPPWAVYTKGNSSIYVGIDPDVGARDIHRVAVFNNDYSRACIYNDSERETAFLEGGLPSLTFFPTDQILLARVLADREGCYLHSSGVVFQGAGFLFVGHSEAGKSTIVRMLKDQAQVLCDDRMIVRKWPDGYTIYGTWSHGDVPDVSRTSAPLKAILFLDKAAENQLIRLRNNGEITRKLLACLIKPLTTDKWWEKMLTLVEGLARDVPCYTLKFDKSGKMARLLDQL
jgi:radical SAM protein with 4Fe4S-binding SPASM domain